ncbi:MAG: PAS domain-containing protein, partial [Draconibacterium sp.]
MDIVNNQWKSSTVLNKIFGITQEDDHSFTSWNKLVHPDQQEEMMDYFLQHVIGKKQAFEKEYKIIRANDGAERWVSGRGELRFNEAGEPIRMVGTIHDITDQKLFEQQLQESEERFRNSILL